MRLILKNIANESVKSLSFHEFDLYQTFIEELGFNPNLDKAVLIIANEEVKAWELAKLKLTLEKLNVKFLHIFSNNREAVLSGKSLKINSTLMNIQDLENEFLKDNLYKKKDLLHKGTVRSGDRISSNGDLFIFGDVNPGAIVSANNNVYVWGKLSGIALAGENGDKNAFIASLYLNPLQLRICNIVAIGPKDKPRHKYPEVAVLQEQKIIIKPYLLNK